MKQARRHIFQPTFPPTPKHTCRGGSHAYKDGERQRGRKNNTSKLFPLNCPSCSSLPVGIWPETSPTADRRNRSPGSTEKSVSMFSNVAVRSQSGTVSPPPTPKSFLFSSSFFSPAPPSSSPPSSGLLWLSLQCVIPPVVGGSAAPCSPFSGFLSFSLPAGSLADTTLCFTRREWGSAREGEREREAEAGRGSASAAGRVCDVTRRELIE